MAEARASNFRELGGVSDELADLSVEDTSRIHLPLTRLPSPYPPKYTCR